MKTRIVIAGGGFAGVYAAMYLDKTLARSRDVEVVLISRENLLLFTPMLQQIGAAPRLSAMPREAVRALVLLVSPFAPHVAEELWRHLGHAASLAYEPWPAWDEALAVDDLIELPVQVNGKVRGRVQLARDASEADARAAALAADRIAARLAGLAVRKFVYVPGQVVNLVAG
jgi:leucyl-tRNA synthetase